MMRDMSLAVQFLAGAAVVLAIIAQAVQIWKSTRPVPPISDQIRGAVSDYARAAAAQRENCRKEVDKDVARLERRLEPMERNIQTLEKNVAALDERSRRRL